MKTRTVTMSLKQDITGLVEQYPKYAWIKHDKDFDRETGELKDEHFHIYLEFPNPRSLNAIANELGIESNMIEVVRNKDGILNYLTHARSPEKYQYDISEVHSNFEIKRIEDALTMITILRLLKDVATFDEFVAEVTKRGMSGNPLANLSYCSRLWRNVREVNTHQPNNL